MIDKTIFSSYQPVDNHYGRKGRYSYAVVEYQAQKLFLKTSLTPTGIGDIKRELVWADFMVYINKNSPNIRVRSPRKLRLLDESNLLMEYIDAPVVAKPNDGMAWRENIDRYVDTLVDLDTVAESYEIPGSLKTYHIRNIDAALNRWLRDVPVTPSIRRGLDCVSRSKSVFSYRLQHGDLTPWQIFELGKEWVIFDGERAGDDLPRFNDLAYSYGRLAIRCGDKLAADYMVEEFVKRRSVNITKFWKQFRPVLAFRLLGMIGDATRDNSLEELEIAICLLEDLINRTD